MRNFRNFHAKITPLIAIFALVAFSIFAFIKLPAFAEDHAQDLNKTDAFSAGSGQDLNKTEVLCGGSAGSGQGAQNGSVQTPSNEQEQDLNENRVSREHSAGSAEHEQDSSVITPLDAQTDQNQQAQDNCAQTHSAEQDLESNSHITHLNTQISAQVPSRVQSTTITPKASTGANIVLSDDAEATASGAGWTYDSATSVYTILNGANVTISGTTTNKRVVVASGATATVTLNGASMDQSSKADASASVFSISAGASVTLKLQGENTIKSGSNPSSGTGYAGLNVVGGATLTIESIGGSGSTEGSLTANGGDNGPGIGGNSYATSGIIVINGGTITATGNKYASGIGSGASCVGANIIINGGNVTATGGGNGGAGIGGDPISYIRTITINGGVVTATGGYGGGAGIGGSTESPGGNITVTGGVVIATGGSASVGITGGSIGSGYNGTTNGSVLISGGTIVTITGKIGYSNGGTISITISEHPIILAPGGINGKSQSDDNRANGILIGDDVSISGTDPITVTINVDMTIPSGATFQVPEGVKVVVPSDKTLTVAEGGTLDIAGELENEGTLDIADNADVVTESGGQISGGGTVNKTNGSDVSSLTLISKTSTSITINPATLSSTTGQDIEYAISTTNELPASEEDWHSTTSEGTITIEDSKVSFTGLAPNTQYYIFARSKESTTHKAGTANSIQVKTAAQVAYTNSNDTGHSTSPWWTFESGTGTLIINLENVYAATGSTSVEVVGDACGGYSSACRLSIQHLAFTNAEGHVTELTIGDGAFYQQFTTEGNTSLTSVTFPDSIQVLTLGGDAFAQSASNGNISLASVSFPNSLTNLNIGKNAFWQSTENGNTTLQSVSFPNSLTTLNIGENSFFQFSYTGGNTTLQSVTFPNSLTTLNIGNYAFEQRATNGNTSLASVTFPDSLTTLNIGMLAFYQDPNHGTSAFKYAFLPSSHLPANTTVASGAFQSGKSIYWLGADGVEFNPTHVDGGPTLTQLPLTELTAAAPAEEELNIATGSPVSFEGVQAIYGGGENQPTFGPVELAPETSSAHEVSLSADDVDFTKYKIISTVSGEPDTNAQITDNSITFTSTGERTVTLSVPGFGEDVVKAYSVNVSDPIPVDPNTPDNPTSPINPSANSASTIGTAITGVPANALGLVMLLLLLVGAGFVRARRKMV